MVLCLIMVGNGVRPQIVSAQSGPRTRLAWETEPGFDPSESNPSLDGRYIAFSDWSTGDLWVRDLTTGASHRLTNEGYEKGYAEGAVISPDSSQIAYRWDDTKESYQLRIVPTAGGAQKTVFRITQPGEYFAPAGWTPDGKQLLVIHGLPDHTTQLALFSTAERTLRPIKSFSWQRIEARLSPDGRYIAYSLTVSEKGNARDIFILATEGSQETAVVENPADDFGPVWSPDGSRLLFLSDRTGINSLWSIAVEAGKPKGDATLIKRDIGQVTPLGMSRSGTYYYFVNGNSSPNIYSAELDPDGKLSKAPTLAIDKFIGSNVGSSISPDGKRLAYTSNREGQGWIIVIRSLETGEDREVPKKVAIDKIQSWGYGPVWFPDGHSLLVRAIDPKQRGTRNPRKNALLKAGNKNDRVDARKLTALLRAGLLTPVYHGESGVRTLRELSRSYLTVTTDLTRVMNRLKAIYRRWAIPCAGQEVYSPRHRAAWLEKLREAGVCRRAELLYQQLDALVRIRREARGELLAESRKHPASQLLQQIPRLGPIRVALLSDPDTEPIPYEATTMGLLRAGPADAEQRRISVHRGTTAAFPESTGSTRSQRQP